jgi:hypothetical protein
MDAVAGAVCARRLSAVDRGLQQENDLIDWPAIIKYADDAELQFISDETVWRNDPDLHDYGYAESDCLVDVSGTLYSLSYKVNGCINPQPAGRSMGLQEILGLVKAHAAQKGSCCVARLYAPTIADAFAIVASLDDA